MSLTLEAIHKLGTGDCEWTKRTKGSLDKLSDSVGDCEEVDRTLGQVDTF